MEIIKGIAICVAAGYAVAFGSVALVLITCIVISPNDFIAAWKTNRSE